MNFRHVHVKLSQLKTLFYQVEIYPSEVKPVAKKTNVFQTKPFLMSSVGNTHFLLFKRLLNICKNNSDQKPPTVSAVEEFMYM